jgi:hypothetical protein
LPLPGSAGKGAPNGLTASLIYYWKSIISKLVGEVSLTGFLFVYASNEALW